MAVTKTTGEIDAWAEIAQAGFRAGSEEDIEDGYSVVLHIDVAIAETSVAHTGTEIIVETGTDTGNARDNWSEVTRFIGPTGTAVDAPFLAQEAVGQTTLSITDPVTNDMDNNKKKKFINAATEADSEIVYQLTSSNDATDEITIDTGLAHQQETTSIILDIDDPIAEAVKEYQVSIPDTADRVRVKYNNNFDPDGATAFTRCRITKITGV